MKRFLVVFVYFTLILSTVLVFWQVRNFDFVNYDDNVYVYENQHVLNGLTLDGIIWTFTTCYFGYWQPMTLLSLMLDCQLFGPDPGRIHLVSVFLHLANTLLLFAVLKKMTGSLWPSAFVAAAFALHPMHVESVAWIAERKDVLSTFFFLLTLAAYIGYVRHRGPLRYLLTILLFVLGLLAKPMLVTLPFLLLLLDYWPLNRFIPQPIKTSGCQSRKSSALDRRAVLYQIIIEKIPFFVLSAVSSIITFLTQQADAAIVDIKTVLLADRVGNVFLSYTSYISKMFWPQNLAVLYPPNIGSFTFWQIALCALLLLAISIFVICFGQNKKYLPVGWFWFVGTLIPVIGIVKFTWASYSDRFTYIPYIGLFIMIAWFLPELLLKWRYRKIAIGMAAAMVLTAMGVGTYRQIGYWKNSLTLFTHAIEVTQNNYIAHCNLGVAYGKLNRWQDAVEAYSQAIRSKPDFAEAHHNLGITYHKLGRWRDAVEAYKQTIRSKPDYAEAYYHLGVDYGKIGRLQDAIEAYKQAIKIKPDYVDAHYNLGVAYLITGDKDLALEEYKIVKIMNTGQANKLFNLIYK